MKMNGLWVPCVRNFYSFMPIALKLCVCYGHGLKLCMWFGYNPQIILFCHFFIISTKSFFQAAAPVAKWLRSLTSVLLIIRSSHRCGFAPRTIHLDMSEKA